MKLQQIKKIVLIGVFCIAPQMPVNAIQEKTANIGTVALAALSAAGSYQAWLLTKKQVHPAVFGVASTLFVSFMYYHFHSVTPRGRLKRATKLLDELSRHKLVKNSFDTEVSFFDTVGEVYLTDDLPLISAYNHLIGLLPTVHYALSLISKASAQIGNNSLLQEECDSVSSWAKELFVNISSAIKMVREHKDYLTQLKIYKEFLANEKQAFVQQQMADAHVQIAQAQKSSTLLKWLKALFWGR
jgi:hypothetical protein